MKDTKHPLLNKQISKLPRNWTEWFQQWETSSDPLALQSLIHHGPEMIGASHSDSREKAVIFYLRLATRFYDRTKLFGEFCPDDEPTIFRCPKHFLAKAAFQTLLKWKFRKNDSNKEPWSYFMHEQGGDLIGELCSFLGLDGLEICNEDDGLNSLISSSRERHKDILTEFCVGFAKAIIVPEFRGHQDDANRESWLRVWRPFNRHALKILWHFDQLNFLLENEMDSETIAELKKLILAQKTIFYSDHSNPRKPKSVEEVLKKCSGYFDRDKKLKRAACIYVGLAQV